MYESRVTSFKRTCPGRPGDISSKECEARQETIPCGRIPQKHGTGCRLQEARKSQVPRLIPSPGRVQIPGMYARSKDPLCPPYGEMGQAIQFFDKIAKRPRAGC